MTLKFGAKEWFVFIISIIILTDLAIFLDVPVLRVIFGFLCFTIVPGMLILIALKLNKIGIVEKIVLSVGLSVSFLMLFGFLIDQLYFSLGYATPLSTISLVVTFSAAMIILCITGYKTNKEGFSFALPNLSLNTAEKAFLIIPITFPALSILGTHIINITGNNIVLMFLLFLIPIYVVLMSFLRHRIPKRVYPVTIFLISISLILLWSLRSNHILGSDIHVEYYFYQKIFSSLHWGIIEYSTVNTCLSVTLLPAIYQSILNVNGEYFLKIFYSSIFSLAPLIIFILSKKYVEVQYAFLASFFFMSQKMFMGAAATPRTILAVFFFACALMVLFNDGINTLKKRILFIIFMASGIVSHYSTAYIFFIIILMSWLLMEIFAKKYNSKKFISSIIVLLFFAFIFFWYSQLTETSFDAGVTYVNDVFSSLNQFFILETKSVHTEGVFGEGIAQKLIPQKMEFVANWATLVLIGIGILTVIIKRKEMVAFSNFNGLKAGFLKTKLDVGYFALVLACSGILLGAVTIPHVLQGYDPYRFYILVVIILSVLFVIGGITISKYLRLQPYLVILLVLIFYFVCCSSTGLMYQVFDVPRSIVLNSEGVQCDRLYIYDQDIFAATWLEINADQRKDIYRGSSRGNNLMFMSHDFRISSRFRGFEHKKIDGYIYLGHYNIIKGKLIDKQGICNMTEYSDIFVEADKIYDSGGSEIWASQIK